MPFMRCPKCQHTDHATGTEAMPCTSSVGCPGIMVPEPKRAAADYGPQHLVERHAFYAEAKARAEVNEMAAATSGTSTNDSLDGRVVLPPAARAMLDAAATSSVTTEAEQAAARAVLEGAAASPDKPSIQEVVKASRYSITLEAVAGLEGGDIQAVDVREVSDDGTVPLATAEDLRRTVAAVCPDPPSRRRRGPRATGLELPEIAPPPWPAEAALARSDLRRLEEVLGELFPDTLNAAAGPPVDVAIELLRDMAKLRDTYRETAKPLNVTIQTIDVKSEDPDRFAAGVVQAFKDAAARAYPSVTVGDVRRAAMEAGAAACEVVNPEGHVVMGYSKPTHEDGLRQGALAVIEQVMDVIDEQAAYYGPDIFVHDDANEERRTAKRFTWLLGVLRRRLQDVGV